MLISTNPTTDYIAAHGSVVDGRECSTYENGDCKEFKGDWIGYSPAWRCVLGAGDETLNGVPRADAGATKRLSAQEQAARQ